MRPLARWRVKDMTDGELSPGRQVEAKVIQLGYREPWRVFEQGHDSSELCSERCIGRVSRLAAFVKLVVIFQS